MPVPAGLPVAVVIFYLHGFASSARFDEDRYFSERLREHGVTPGVSRFQRARLPDADHDADARSARAPSCRPPAVRRSTLIGSSLGGTLAILAAAPCAVASRPARAAGARGDVRQAGPSSAAAGTDRRVARAAASLPFFHYAANAAAGARLRVLRGQPSLRCVQRRRAAADADLSGAPRCVSRSSDRRAVRRRAPERHACRCSTTTIS